MGINASILTKNRLFNSLLLLLFGFVGLIVEFLLTSKELGDTFSFFLFFSKFIGICGIIYILYNLLIYVNFLGFDRLRSVSLFFGITVGILFILADKKLTFFEPVKEFSIDARFRISSIDFSQEDIVQGVIRYSENKKAHPSLQIIGIDNATVNEYQEGFPFTWRHYSDLLKALNKSNYKTLLFDIFFLDQKKDSFDQEKGKKGKLSTVFQTNQKVMADYPFETQAYPLSEEQRILFKKKLRIFKKNEILNVIPTEYDRKAEWVKFPELLLLDILKNLYGIGYANIRKQDTGVNRTLPLVIKWQNKIYPSIDLVTLAHYYNINIQKDIEVKLGSYVKLKNIPEATIQVYDRDSKNNILVDSKGNFKKKSVDIIAKPNSERNITIPIDGEGFMYINFIGGPWSYPSISFHTVADSGVGSFSGNNDPFKDKILLVAIYYATGVAKDVHASPFGDISGIEHHANALNTILKQDFIRYAPAWLNYLIYVLTGAILGFIIARFKITLVLVGICLFSILFAVECLIAFNLFNFIHVFFVPYIEIAIVMISVVGYKVLNEEQNVKYIESTFSKFVSADVVRELLENPESISLGGISKNITVFFSDIRGFTTISESLTPKDLVSLLNEYFSEMTKICLRYYGTIDKYMGDAIMAFWGAPIYNQHHPYQACLTALVQLEVLNKLQKKWRAEGRPILDIGIGLNTGNAVVGNIGSSLRMDYTVMGDVVNLGARLEGINKVYGTKIIISESTYQAVKDKVISRELDSIRVKGKSQPILVYELIDVKNQGDFISFAKKKNN